MHSSPNFVASGSISPSRFVFITGDNQVAQAIANSPVFGVSQEGVMYAPGTAADNGLAATDGRPIKVYGPTETCYLELGATVAATQYVKSDASGKGTSVDMTATTLQYIGGRVLVGGASGEKVRFFVFPFATSPGAT